LWDTRVGWLAGSAKAWLGDEGASICVPDICVGSQRREFRGEGSGACMWSTETDVSRDGDVASLYLRKCPVNTGACVQSSRTTISRWRGKPRQDKDEVVVLCRPCKVDGQMLISAFIKSCSEPVARVG
jgi:hypothetical protein